VTKQRRREGELRTLSTRTVVIPVTDKVSPGQPDYRVLSQKHMVLAGLRTGQTSASTALSIAAPGFGARRSTPISVVPPVEDDNVTP
jgi:uncharacterized protein (DUF736 family)